MNTYSRAARRARTVAAVMCGGAFAAALLAACGSQPAHSTAATPGSGSGSSTSTGAGTGAAAGSTSPSPSASTSTKPPVQTAPRMPASQCPVSALRVTVSGIRGGAAAGTNYVPLDFTNISSHSCEMYGFPGVSFVTGHPGTQIGDAASRVTTFGSETVTLASGGTAHSWLGIADAGNFPASACRPVTAHWLKAYPPDQFAALYASFTTTVCSKKITGGSTPLTVTPVRPGPGVAGTVP